MRLRQRHITGISGYWLQGTEMYVAPDAIMVNGAIDTLIELKHFAFIISK